MYCLRHSNHNVFHSLGAEKKAQAVIKSLRGYVQTLTYYQATSIAGPEKPMDSQKMSESVFTVPFERDPRYIDRADITSQLEKRLQNHHRAALAGIGGVG